FRDRIQSACRLTVNNKSVYLIAPGGHPLATIEISTANEKITRIAVRSAQGDDRYAAALPCGDTGESLVAAEGGGEAEQRQ
ncbi:hypothetical protein ACWD3X_37485, partial [Streptomyces sp. NPDC002666]